MGSNSESLIPLDPPNHIGIVMDGNGRWAKLRGLPRLMGHKEGVKAAERTIRAASDLGIRCLSLYAFSTENWKRPRSEVIGLMALLEYYVKIKAAELAKERVRLRFAGKIEVLSPKLRMILEKAEHLTASGDKLDLIVCLNYGGRQEILDAVTRILEDKLEPPITEEQFNKYLYLPDAPHPDLLIRTSGELRMSNFWLWQSAYSEYYFTDKYWPDFNKKDLELAIADYNGRERRYGKA
jgi:undecaprenyl diphosphate synthase